MNEYHVPVLVQEVIQGLAVAPGKRYIDATFGGGGHTQAIADLGGMVLAFDVDADAISYGKAQLQARGYACKKEYTDDGSGIGIVDFGSILLVQGSYVQMGHVVRMFSFGPIAGVVFDLGVSSYQVDKKERGFSYRYVDAPIDLRFDTQKERWGGGLVNTASEKELYEIIGTFGEEERAGAIAHAIVRARTVAPIQTAGDLVAIIKRLVPGEKERTKVLARLYQALRIAVNDELATVAKGLAAADSVLKPGGRVAVVSFHSLEDRMVKQFFRQSTWTMVNKKPMHASAQELARNPRARSAKLRIGEKI